MIKLPYYFSIILDPFCILLYLKLFQRNVCMPIPVPNASVAIKTLGLKTSTCW